MELYHVLNRGVDKRDIFLEEIDYVRFVNDLYVFNDSKYVDPNFGKDVSKGRFFGTHHDRDELIDIHAFCLMPNHYHILASEKQPDGISKFAHKLNKGYSRYFNEKYKRVGTLWQGTYKKILIKHDGHFLHIPYYIHLNPLDMKMPKWRIGEIDNTKAALAYLQRYRWSSHLDYAGVKNFPSVIQTNLLSDRDLLGNPKAYMAHVERLLRRNLHDTFSTLSHLE